MTLKITLVLAGLAVQFGSKICHHIDVMTDDTKSHEENLRETEPTTAAKEASFLSVYQLWTAAGVLVMLAIICWLVRKMKHNSDSCSKQHSSISKKEEHMEKEGLDSAHSDNGSLAVPTPLPVQGLPNTHKTLKELVDDLLGVCRVLCKSISMPQMHLATEMDGTYETWSIHPTHSFHLEQDSTEQISAKSSIHVELECTCLREQMLGGNLCFLHHPNNKLQKDKRSNLLHTLCTDSYLDVEKTACWFQMLVRTAWLLLPQSHHCQLTVLPSSHSCVFQLTSTSTMNTCTERMLAVQLRHLHKPSVGRGQLYQQTTQ